MQVARLLRAVEVESEHVVPNFDIDEYEGDAEGIAREVRALWGVPRGALVHGSRCSFKLT